MTKLTRFKYLSLSFAFLVALFLLLPTASKAEGDICDVENLGECESSGDAKEYGESGHTDECDKIVYVFYGDECSHCAEFDKYLSEDILKDHPEVEVEKYEVWHNQDNYQKMISMFEEREVKDRAVPTVFVGHQTFVGYGGDDLTGLDIKESIYNLYCIEGEIGERSVDLPFIGEIKTANLSIPVITVVLGLVDGFNPCAMWALVALITILLSTKNKKKIIVIGLSFLISSWLIYYLFISLYLNTFIFLSFVAAIRYLIAVVALVAGIVYIRDFINYQPGVCKVTTQKQQQGLVGKMKTISKSNSLWLMIAGVIALAFSVNLVEMVCSIGLPVIYSQILASSGLSTVQKYLYLALYNTVYMLDDIIIFVIAATTLKYVNVGSRYEKWMKLVGGVLIIVLGVILAFRPDLLSL